MLVVVVVGMQVGLGPVDFVLDGDPAHVLFCSLAVLNPKVGHTMDVLSPFISILCHCD